MFSIIFATRKELYYKLSPGYSILVSQFEKEGGFDPHVSMSTCSIA